VFLLFGGSDDPKGGMRDLVGIFDNFIDADTSFIKFVDNTPSASWGHIWESSCPSKEVPCWILGPCNQPDIKFQVESRLPVDPYGARWWKRL
jgi:hypothetical protein